MPDRTCAAPGCANSPRSRSAELCKKHYHRQYRHGSVERVAHQAGISVSHGRRYRSLHLPNHPLAMRSGRVYEHRAVLYDCIGPGPHVCHWCEVLVYWDPTKGQPLQVDHLNGVGDDNRPDNLVPSCGPCNVARAQQARSAALREVGFWSRHDTVAGLRSGGRRELLPVVTVSDQGVGGDPQE